MNKHLYSIILLFLALNLFNIAPLSSQTPTASIATWKDNKKAAYSIVHDDYSNYVTGIFQYADPIATARGIKLCFGAITNPDFCGPQEWANARTMISHGHECVNHSHNHLCGGMAGQCSGLTTYSSAQFATELGLSSQTIEANTGVKPRFFIHPYDAASAPVISYLTGLGYLGTRAGAQATLNASSFTDFTHLNYFVWAPGSAISELNQAVDQAIAAGGYAMREFHGIADGSWGAMTVANYTNHLDYVRTQMNNGNLWSATATEAITYKMQRDAYQPNAVYSATNSTITVSFASLKTIDPSVLRTPITLNISLNGIVGNFNVSQNGAAIPSVKTGNIVAVNVYPHQGNIVLTCTNCNPVQGTTDVANVSATAQINAALVTWTNPTAAFSDVLVVAKENSPFTTKPVGTVYTADANFDGIGSAFEGGKVVYQGTGTNVTVTGLTAGTTHYFRVFVRNGSTWTNGVEVTAVPTGIVNPNLGCLQATYFNNINLTGTPVATRFETSINNDWGTGKPSATGVNADNFSVRWDGSFTATQTGAYQFTVRADDGVRLWVNKKQIINKWIDQSATSYTASIQLTQGKVYTIKMEYYEKGGSAVAQLSWAPPSQTSKIMPFAANCTTLNSTQSVDLVTLDGRLRDGKAALQWVVNSQKAVDYYQIEKMDAQGDFQTLGIVNDNNQSVVRLYNFNDDKLAEGDNYYRIQTNYLDNNTPQYSEVLKINYLKPQTFNIFPNPAHDVASIDLSEAEGKTVYIRVFSMIGKELFEEKIEVASKTPYQLNLSSFDMGQYMVRIEAVGQRAMVRKLVVGQ
jgi:hypothetical protein